MTDQEYAIAIYRAVFRVQHAGDDAIIDGILSAVQSLDEQERAAFEGRVRYDKSYAQLGRELGIKPQKVSKIITIALHKLRHPSCVRVMSREKSGVHEDRLRAQLAEARAAIQSVQEVLLSGGMTAEDKLLAVYEALNIRVFDLGFSSQAANSLVRAGKNDISAILDISNFSELKDIKLIGGVGREEIIAVMRDMGFASWADKIEAESDDMKS